MGKAGNVLTFVEMVTTAKHTPWFFFYRCRPNMLGASQVFFPF
jgi:hypothetical protein